MENEKAYMDAALTIVGRATQYEEHFLRGRDHRGKMKEG